MDYCYNPPVAWTVAIVQTQAAVISYIDVYLLAVGSTVMSFASLLLQRNELAKGASVSVH